MPKDMLLKVIAIACLIGAMLLCTALVLLEVVPPLPEKFESTHALGQVEPLKGFTPTSVFNVGDAKALDALPGIGEVLSQRIIDGRSILGDYFLPTDLLLVKGIGIKTLKGIMEVLDEPLGPRAE